MRLIAILSLTALLAACGQTGPLYLPNAQPLPVVNLPPPAAPPVTGKDDAAAARKKQSPAP